MLPASPSVFSSKSPLELERLQQDKNRLKNWKRWGTYLPESQWGTVREDYSADGDAWRYFDYEQAHSRAYRWGEDGILGWTDRECRLCFAPAFWNEQDIRLKEKLFGLAGPEGNHGEDVKELYYYLDATPTHSYAKALYKYPQKAFPYAELIQKNRERNRLDPEYELLDTGIFDDQAYFDIFVEYAKHTPDDICIRLSIHNRSLKKARLHVLPTIFFRNTWAWGCTHEGCTVKPIIYKKNTNYLILEHQTLDKFRFYAESLRVGRPPMVLFTENESNSQAIWNEPSYTPYVKDAFNRYLVHQEVDAVNPKPQGTKAAFHYILDFKPQEAQIINLRLVKDNEAPSVAFGADFEKIFQNRIDEANHYYTYLAPQSLDEEEKKIQRQAYAGLLWSKQFYQYSVKDWLTGDPHFPPPPQERLQGRNQDWGHLYNRDILSVPDKWEYPWYAAWDLAFHMVAFAKVDPQFAKDQLILLLREWYMHPNGQIPAYEYAFGDVNPPVHA